MHYHCKKFNHIRRLSQLHQIDIIIRSPRNASKIGFLKFHRRASSLLASFYFTSGYITGISTNWVTKMFWKEDWFN